MADPQHLTFSSHHRPKQPLICPASLRKEGSSLAKARQSHSHGYHTAGSVPSLRHLDISAPPRDSGSPILTLPPSPFHAGPSDAGIPKGYILPRSEWVSDASVAECSYDDCDVKFGPARSGAFAGLGGFTSIIAHPFQSRRHHCRACGLIFCAQHSANSLPLLAVGKEAIQQALSSSTTPGTASPYIPIAPSVSTHARSARSGSSRSGASTPALSVSSSATSNYFSNSTSDFRTSPTSPISPSSGKQEGQIIHSRVCDLCYLSLSLGANLYNPSASYQHHLAHPPAVHPRSPSPSISRAPVKSARASKQASPQNSQQLSPRDIKAAPTTSSSAHSSFDSASSPKNRLRQTSAGTGSVQSTDTVATTPPSAGQSDVNLHNVVVGAAHNGHIVASAQSSVGNSAFNLSSDSSRPRASVKAPNRHAITTPLPTGYRGGDASHPLDPRHTRINIEEDSGGSNPDSSLEAVVPSTPAGWSWST